MLQNILLRAEIIFIQQFFFHFIYLVKHMQFVTLSSPDSLIQWSVVSTNFRKKLFDQIENRVGHFDLCKKYYNTMKFAKKKQKQKQDQCLKHFYENDGAIMIFFCSSHSLQGLSMKYNFFSTITTNFCNSFLCYIQPALLSLFTRWFENCISQCCLKLVSIIFNFCYQIIALK